MKKLFVVDTDLDFQAQIHALCPPDQVELSFYSSGMEIFSILSTDKPQLVFLDLEIEDLNDFVMRDLLKRITVTNSLPLLVTYSDQSERVRKQYEKINYKANGYFKKPVSNDQLKELIFQYLKLEDVVKSDETDTLLEFVPPKVEAKVEGFVEFGESMDDEDDNFSDDNIDRLVRGGSEEIEEESFPQQAVEKDDKESTNPFGEDLMETRQDGPGTIPRSNLDDHAESDLEAEFGLDAKFDDSFLESPRTSHTKQQESPVAAPVSRGDRELENQVISLERQNEFLRTENKKWIAKAESLQADTTTAHEENRQLKNQLDEILGQLHQDRRELERKESGLTTKLETLSLEKSELEAQIENRTEKSGQLQLENNRLLQQVETLEQQLAQAVNETDGLQQQVKQLDLQLTSIAAEKNLLETQITDIANRLTDKEREMVAMNHEFEKHLQEKSDKLIQQTEDRLNSEFKQKEERLIQSLRKFQEETKRRETELRNEIETLSQSGQMINTEKEELKKREDSLNRTVSTLAEEKVMLAEQIASFEKEWARSRQMMDEMEATHRETVDQLAHELEGNRNQIHDLKSKIESLAGLLKNALSLTVEENPSVYK